MKFKTFILLGLFLIISCDKPVVELKLTSGEIQSVIEKKFPYEKNLIIAKLKLLNPVITLKDDMVHYKLDIKFNALSETVVGDFDAAGKLSYNRSRKAFYLKNVQVKSINIEEVNEKYRDKVVSAVNNILNNYFEDFPIYRLKEADYKQNIAGMFLKEVKTENDYLLIRLSL